MGAILKGLATNELVSLLTAISLALILSARKTEAFMRDIVAQMTPNCVLGALVINLFASVMYNAAPSL